jgi:glycosyltransferase involved in cell wall biosynthesis
MKKHSVLPFISIIIPNLNSPIIDKTIESLLCQNTNHRFEIIIVGMDKFNLIDLSNDQVKFLKTEKPTPPAIARNMGVLQSSGDFIFFIDADCIASSDWIENHISIHQRFESPVVVGGGVNFPNDSYLTLSDNISTFHEFMTHIPPGEKDFLPSLNISIPKSVWNLSGGFNTNYIFPSGEDTDLTLRIKMRDIPLFFEPKAIVTHMPNRREISSILKHAYRFGYCSVKSNSLYWEILSVPFPLKHCILTVIFSPLLAAYVIIKIILSENLPYKYWHTLPIIFLLKIAWCIGFAAQIR